MGTKSLLGALCVLLHYIVVTDAILCYQCASTNDDVESAACKYSTRGLAAQRSGHQVKKRSIKRFPNLKNCSVYINSYGEELFPYCKLEIITANGETHGYIRECSNGRDFSEDFNTTRVNFERGFVRADNQSTCGYSRRHYANICVQICDTDFCNGPLAGARRIDACALWAVLLFSFLTYFFTHDPL